jgi:CHAT domain-containing protein
VQAAFLAVGATGLLLLDIGSSRAASFAPTSSWSVSLQTTAPGPRATCTATAGYTLFPNELIETEAELSIRPDGAAALRFSTTPGSVPPQFTVQQTSTVRPESMPRRAWFDRGTAFSVTYVTRGLAYLEMDFGGADRLLAGLDGSRKLTLETEPARSGIGEYGQRASAPNSTVTYVLADTPKLVGQLRACLQSLRTGQPFTPAPTAPAPVPDAVPQPSLAALIESRNAAVLAVERDHPGSAVLATALMRLADAEADAFQLRDARETYRKALALAARYLNDVPDQQQARARLIDVELALEQPDEAEADAQSTPYPRPWLAAISVMRGDHKNGEKQFLMSLGEVAGQQFVDLQALKLWADRDDRTAPDRLWLVRQLLTLWARAALGQEDWMSFNLFHNLYGYIDPSGSGNAVPAARVAETVFWSTDATMIRDDVRLSATDRTTLGQAAFLRGESLRHAGNLASVSADFAYAATELRGVPQAQGWAERIRVAHLQVAADLGFDGPRPLDDPQAPQNVLHNIESNLGPRSEVALEAAAVAAELQLRQGDAVGAETVSLHAAETAAAALSDTHSLTMRLRLLAAEARYARQDYLGAGQLATRALGFSALPVVSADQLRALQNDPALASDKAAALRAFAGLVGTPPPARLDRPVVQRIQARRAEVLLDRVVRSMPETAERMGLHAILEFARAEDAALLQADRDRPRLDQLPSEKLASVLQNFEFRRPSDGLNLSMVDVLLGVGQMAAEYLRPDVIVPADFRPTIRYGEETTALEYLLHGLHRRFDAPGMNAHDREVVMDVAIRLVAAASRGDASGTISANLFSSAHGIWNVPMGNADKTREAVSSALFSQRLRSSLRLQLNDATDGAAGAAERRLYVKTLAYANQASAALATAFGPAASEASAFAYIAGTHAGPVSASVQDYMQNLGPHEAVVIWLPLETSTEAFVISPHGLAWHNVSEGRRALGRHVAKIRQAIKSASSLVEGGRQPRLADFPADEATALYHALFDPLQADLQDVTHLFTAQLGVVGNLPLHLLRTDAAGNDASPAWLGDRFAITRMPGLISPGLVYGNAPPNTPTRRLLAIGAPAMPATPAAADDVFAAIRDLPRLDNALAEMRQVAQDLGVAGNQATILQGRDATWGEVVQALGASDHDVMMFATHGLGEQDVGEPALLLTPPARRTWSDDGLLRASDIAALHAPADLVILSACSTASLGENGGEALAGLASAFLTAGGRNVVASYWVLDDDAAPELTGALVRARYAGHLDVAEALQQAMANLRGPAGNGQPHEHPVYWAVFEAIGLPWLPSAHVAVVVAPKPAPPTAPLRAPRTGTGAAPVPLDPEASRVIEEAFQAENRLDCQIGQEKIRELDRLFNQGQRSHEQQAQMRNAAMELILADQHCETVRNIQRGR